MIPVKDHEIKKGTKVSELVKQMASSGGFSSKKLADAVDIIIDMQKHSKLNFLSFPACIISTGTRGIIRDMVKNKMFQCIITTCGMLDHDIARSFEDYYHGDFMLDDIELRKKNICRLGNVLLPDKSYGIILEKKMQEWLPEIFKDKKELSVHELCWEFGKRMKEDSILYWAWKNQIPVIIPGITDGAIGYHLWEYSQDHKIIINVLKDEQLLSDMTWNAKKSGALILGGGISKHHVIWWNQFKDGLDYTVYISTAVEYDGSLSGARPREAISWGKINKRARHVHLEADVTTALPLIYAALIDRIK
jgi:deoxyhypusine synthase